MKNIVTIVSLAFMLLLLPIVHAQEASQPTEDPGVTPDSFLWGLDKAWDNINIFITFDKGEKAKKGLELAKERLLEVRVMIEENKLDAAKKAKEEHGKVLIRVKENVKAVEKENSTEEMKEELEIEQELQEHEQDIEDVNTELEVKITIKGITEEQQAFITSFLASLQGQLTDVEIEIKNKKDKTKVKIRQETGRSDDDVDDIEEEMKRETGLSNFERERAEKMRRKAEQKWDEVVQKAEKAGIAVPNKTMFNELLAQGNVSLAQGRHEEAKDIYEEAKDHAEDLKKEVEKAGKGEKEDDEDDDEESDDAELEIEVEIEDGVAKVKIEIGDDEQEFVLETTDKEAILSQIASRLGVTVEQIRNIVEFEIKGKAKTGEGEKDRDREKDDDEADEGEDEEDSG